MNKFSTMDLETMGINGIQIPIAISTCDAKTSKLFVIDSVLIKTYTELAVNKLWKQ